MPSTSYGNQPPQNGPGQYPMGASMHQPAATQFHQQHHGAPTLSQPLAGPMPSGKQPEQFPGHGGMSAGMMSGGGVPAMAGPSLNSGQMPAMSSAGNCTLALYSFLLSVIASVS